MQSKHFLLLLPPHPFPPSPPPPSLALEFFFFLLLLCPCASPIFTPVLEYFLLLVTSPQYHLLFHSQQSSLFHYPHFLVLPVSAPFPVHLLHCSSTLSSPPASLLCFQYLFPAPPVPECFTTTSAPQHFFQHLLPAPHAHAPPFHPHPRELSVFIRILPLQFPFPGLLCLHFSTHHYY